MGDAEYCPAARAIIGGPLFHRDPARLRTLRASHLSRIIFFVIVSRPVESL